MAQVETDSLDEEQFALFRRRVLHRHWRVREVPALEDEELVWFIFGRRGMRRFIARGDTRQAAWFAAMTLANDAARGARRAGASIAPAAGTP
jgi:hypothetical protein